MSPPLAKAPVFFTLAQVRFSPVLKMQEFVPAIQEGLRKIGYPIYEVVPTVAIEMTMIDGQASPRPLMHDRYLFGNVERTHAFLLAQNGLTLQSTRYGDFETFSAVFLRVLQLVNDVVSLALTNRIGLRYLDRVFPEQGENLSQYLVPEALGLGSKLGGTLVGSFIESVTQFESRNLISRAVVQNGPLAFPPDLGPLNMVIEPRLLAYAGPYVLLDNDGFFEGAEAFSMTNVEMHLHAIHEIIGNAFKALATSFAFEAWGKPA